MLISRTENNIFPCFLGLAALFFSLSPQILFASELRQPDKWSARTAIAFAIANNPSNHVAIKRIAQSRAMIDLAEASYHPRLNLSTSYEQTTVPMYSFGNILNQEEFHQDINFNDPGRTDSLRFQASLSYNLYNGGRDKAALTTARLNEQAARSRLQTTRANLSFEVVRSLQKIIQAEDMSAARQSALKAIEASLAVAKSRFKAGDLLKADLLNIEVQYSRARENLIVSNHQLALARKSFLNLLGLPDQEVRIDREQCTVQLPPSSRNFDIRPELQELDLTVNAAESRLRSSEGSRLPTVNSFASYQYDKGFETEGAGDSWMAGLKLNYALYDGQAVSASIRAAQADVERLKMEKKRLELALDLEVARADLAYNQATERISVTDKMVEQAKESARLSRVRFQEGVILSSDLIDTETRLTDALVRQTVAHTDILIAIADLRRALGLSQCTGNEEAGEKKTN